MELLLNSFNKNHDTIKGQSNICYILQIIKIK